MNTKGQENVILAALTRSRVYRSLAKAFSYPSQETSEFICRPVFREAFLDLADTYDGDAYLRQRCEELTAMHSSLSAPGRREVLELEFNRLFAHIGSATCPPYETEYGNENVFQKTAAMADIAGFYNAYGLEVSSTNTDRVDFIGTELEFMSYLSLHEAYAIEHSEDEHLAVCIDTQRKFLAEHLGRWVTVLTRILSDASRDGFYSWLGAATDKFVELEISRLGVEVQMVTGPGKGKQESPEPFECSACVSPELGGEAPKNHAM